MLAVCVRHENFSHAAAELGITPTAVSQRMRALEADIGKGLFRRRGPSLTATDHAKKLGQTVEHALSLMRRAVDDCSRAKDALRVTCASTFAARWLLPRLANYQALTAADAITLDTAQTISPAGTFDVAIRSGAGPWDGYDSVRLLTDLVTPMLSPRWISEDDTMKVGALLKIPLIPDPRWQEWFELAGMPNAMPTFVHTRFPNYELEMEAAVRGIGAALLPSFLYWEPEAQGKLVAPFPWAVEGPASYWLLWTKDAANSHFVGWIKSQFGIGPTI
jgi:LysR family glycine cleavage system transcriptional activator